MVIDLEASFVPRVVRRFGSLPATKKRLAVEAALALTLALLLVRLVSARLWLPHVRAGGTPRPGRASAEVGTSPPQVPGEIGRAVAKVARHLPFRAKCLPQAMAARWMLRRRGIQATVVFGVRRNDTPEGELDFHAWLISGGETIIGELEVETYSAFPPFADTESKRLGKGR